MDTIFFIFVIKALLEFALKDVYKINKDLLAIVRDLEYNINVFKRSYYV